MKNILIVDDDKLVREMFVRALQEFNVSEAVDGENALEIIRGNMPDVVITDLKMPKMNGVDLLKRLRTSYPNLPVIGISGYLTDGRGEALGFDSFLNKPLSLKVLKEHVTVQLTKTA